MEAPLFWKRLSDKKEVELLSYLQQWIAENPLHKIYIGRDSHNQGNKTIFATVIVLHYGVGGGGHVLFEKTSVERIQDRYNRLWKEVELSVAAAQLLLEFGLSKPDYIDIDLNPDPKFKSNSVLRAAVGLIESLGIKARYKTTSPWAISVADSLCK
jgi:predicted RNase H-related nuclease YkuK (DUF458 family)